MAKIPIIIAPFCSLAINAPIAMSPIKAQNWPVSCVQEPASVKSIRVAGLSTIHPAFCMPIMVRKRPIPAIVAILRSFGIALIIAVRAPA